MMSFYLNQVRIRDLKIDKYPLAEMKLAFLNTITPILVLRKLSSARLTLKAQHRGNVLGQILVAGR